MLIRIFSPTECGLIRDADLKKCGLNRMTTVYHRLFLVNAPYFLILNYYTLCYFMIFKAIPPYDYLTILAYFILCYFKLFYLRLFWNILGYYILSLIFTILGCSIHYDKTMSFSPPPLWWLQWLSWICTTSKWLKGVLFVYFAPLPKLVVSIMTKETNNYIHIKQC